MNSTYLSLLLAGCVALVGGKSFGQENAQDSLVRHDTVRIKPNQEAVSVRSLGNFISAPNDPIGFQTYAGFGVFNVLRGHYPGYYPGAGFSGMSGSQLLVIDGLPYQSSFGSYYNLNAFEYADIYALRSGNAVTSYGGAGANGAIFLQSKNGEGVDHPMFEFNLSPSMGWYDIGSVPGISDSDRIKQWNLTNSIAYQQDFGMVDTRVSYSYTRRVESDFNNFKNQVHSARINTGFSIANRFKARLIMDLFYNPALQEDIPVFNQPSQTYDTENTEKNRQASLHLQYKALDWLMISSQGALSKIETESHSGLYAAHGESDMKRDFLNLFLTAGRKLSSSVSFSSFIGGQIESQEYSNRMVSAISLSESRAKTKSKALVGGGTLGFREMLFADLNIRRDYFANFSPENNGATSYSVNTGFVFSKAMGLESKVFSYGKLRASIGKASIGIQQQYPESFTIQGSGGLPNPSLHPSEKSMREFGVDLQFLNQKLDISITHFNNKEEDLITLIQPPPGSGYVGSFVNWGTLISKGVEVFLGATPVRKSQFEWRSQIGWTTYDSEIELEGASSGGGGSGTSIGDPNPDWMASVLNQLTYKRFFTSILVDLRHGGDIVTISFPSEITIEDGSMTRLRDVSLGYRVRYGNTRLKEVQCSLSGRNLWIDSKSPSVEGGQSGSVQKMVCLSISGSF